MSGDGRTWLPRNPLCVYQTHCGRGAWLESTEVVEDSMHQAITPEGCSCRGAKSEPVVARVSARQQERCA